MLHDSVVVVVAVAVVRTRPLAIPLAMITMRKSTHGFPFLSYMSMGLRYDAVCARVTGLRIVSKLENIVNTLLEYVSGDSYYLLKVYS